MKKTLYHYRQDSQMKKLCGRPWDCNRDETATPRLSKVSCQNCIKILKAQPGNWEAKDSAHADLSERTSRQIAGELEYEAQP